MTKVIGRPLGGLCLPIVTAANVLNRKRTIVYVIKIKIFWKLWKRHSGVNIFMWAGKRTNPTADIMWVNEISDHEIRLLLIFF